jgi:hypothetical protein
MHSTFSKASVVLEHSAYIGKISCTRGGMVIPFTEETAYTTAKTHWPSSGGFVIVSHTAQCGQDKSGQRTHWTIQKAEAHDRDQTITVLATEIELEQALHGAHLQYGMYQPQKEFPSGGDKSKLRRQVSSPMGTCGTPPASTPSGIPATYCGAGFDQRLDSELGFLSFATPEEFSASLRIIAPHLDDYTQSDYDIANLVDEPSTAPNKRAFHGVRAANPRIFIEVHKRIREQRKVLLGSLNNLVEEVATLVKETAQRAAEFVVDLTHRKFGPSAYANLAISAVPKNLTTSPFSKTKTDVKIFNTTGTFKGGEAELSAYCVNCGIRGSIHLYGEVLFTLADGLTSANLNLDGNIAGRLVLGIDAHIKYTFEDRKQVFDAGVPGSKPLLACHTSPNI